MIWDAVKLIWHHCKLIHYVHVVSLSHDMEMEIKNKQLSTAPLMTKLCVGDQIDLTHCPLGDLNKILQK